LTFLLLLLIVTLVYNELVNYWQQLTDVIVGIVDLILLKPKHCLVTIMKAWHYYWWWYVMIYWSLLISMYWYDDYWYYWWELLLLLIVCGREVTIFDCVWYWGITPALWSILILLWVISDTDSKYDYYDSYVMILMPWWYSYWWLLLILNCDGGWCHWKQQAYVEVKLKYDENMVFIVSNVTL